MVRGKVRFLATLLLLWLAGAAVGEPIPTVGLNLYRDSPEFHPFWKACGYNTLEFLDQGWYFRPDLHLTYYAAFAKEIANARQEGFKVYVLLCTNMLQWPGPGENGPPDYLERFDPTNAGALATRLDYLKNAITQLKQADGFILVAGDPGGNSELFNTTLGPLINMARTVRGLVYTHAGVDKDFLLNGWAVSYWMDTPTSAYTRQLWDEEVAGTRALVQAADLLGSVTGSGGRRVGIEFSTDNYYRPLALSCYASQPQPPLELYPQATDLAALAGRGVGAQWGWPYFLVDEADGGYGTNGLPQGEVRYIKQYVDTARALGLGGVVGNLSFAGRAAESLNAYALGRLCQAANAEEVGVDEIYQSFAARVASAATAGRLESVLRFLENKSTWHESLPAAKRLAALSDGETRTAYRALVRLRQVQPNPVANAATLPEPPADYLRRVQSRLEGLAAGEAIAPASSYDADGGELIGLGGSSWAGDANMQGGLDGALAAAEDRGAAVVSTNPALSGFASRLDQPLTLRRSHAPDFVRIGYRRNAAQHGAARIWWDDVLLGTIDARGTGEELATAELAVSAALKGQWASFTRGLHLLTLEVPAEAGAARYFELDALWLADTPTRYLPSFSWDLARDYSMSAAALTDEGSVRLPANEGLSLAAPNQPVWTLGYYTSRPFNPATMAFDPAKVTPLSAETRAGTLGAAHGEPDAAAGAELGQVSGQLSAIVGSATLGLYARGLGSAPVPQVGVSVSPAIVAFRAPHAGLYRAAVNLRGRKESWHNAATLYHEAAVAGPRQQGFNGSAMSFARDVSLKAGERLFLVVEGTVNGAWSEVLIERCTVQFVRGEAQSASVGWDGYRQADR